MQHFLLSTILSFAGLGAAIALFIASLLLLLKKAGKSRYLSLLYLGISGFYGYSLTVNLIRQSSGIRCAMAPLQTLVVYGGLLALHLYFLWDTLRLLKSE